MPNDSPFLVTPEVAARLRCSVRTVHELTPHATSFGWMIGDGCVRTPSGVSQEAAGHERVGMCNPPARSSAAAASGHHV